MVLPVLALWVTLVITLQNSPIPVPDEWKTVAVALVLIVWCLYIISPQWLPALLYKVRQILGKAE